MYLVSIRGHTAGFSGTRLSSPAKTTTTTTYYCKDKDEMTPARFVAGRTRVFFETVSFTLPSRQTTLARGRDEEPPFTIRRTAVSFAAADRSYFGGARVFSKTSGQRASARCPR